MKKTVVFYWILIFSLMISSFSFGQSEFEPDSIVSDTTKVKKGFIKSIIRYFEEAKKDKSQEKFDISLMGGPSYSVDTKLGLGLVASGLYRLDKENLDLPPSDLSIYGNITTSGFMATGVESNSIFPDDQYRLHIDFRFSYMPTHYYGIGYEAGQLGEITHYDEIGMGIKTNLSIKIIENTFGGLSFKAKNVRGLKFEHRNKEPDEPLENRAIGGGYYFVYDSRDFIPNPKQGFLAKFEQSFYPTFLGSNRNFKEIQIDVRAYHQAWKNGILAFDLNGDFKMGDVPWNMLSLVGGPNQMRGYYLGKYRDKKQINTQLEIRQKIYNRHGVVAWGGTGKVFDSFSNWNWQHFLPNFGFGYRWEFKNRVNIRLDYGFGKYHSGFYFNINEAF